MDFKKYTPRYKSLCKKYWGIDVSDQEALDGTVRLFNFARAVTEPIPKSISDFEDIEGGDEKKKPP